MLAVEIMQCMFDVVRSSSDFASVRSAAGLAGSRWPLICAINVNVIFKQSEFLSATALFPVVDNAWGKSEQSRVAIDLRHDKRPVIGRARS
jgi:hypothetical protein